MGWLGREEAIVMDGWWEWVEALSCVAIIEEGDIMGEVLMLIEGEMGGAWNWLDKEDGSASAGKITEEVWVGGIEERTLSRAGKVNS